MGEVKSIKEVINSNIKTKDEKVVRNKSYLDVFIHRDNKWHNVRTESISFVFNYGHRN